jgi:hypothetical protein
MDMTKRIYQRSAVGAKSLLSNDAYLGEESLAVLRFLEHPRHFDEIIKAMLPRCSTGRILSRLEEMEKAGWIESIPVDWLEELNRLGQYQPEPMPLVDLFR